MRPARAMVAATAPRGATSSRSAPSPVRVGVRHDSGAGGAGRRAPARGRRARRHRRGPSRWRLRRAILRPRDFGHGPMEPGSGLVRNGSRLNKIVLVRLDPAVWWGRPGNGRSTASSPIRRSARMRDARSPIGWPSRASWNVLAIIRATIHATPPPSWTGRARGRWRRCRSRSPTAKLTVAKPFIGRLSNRADLNLRASVQTKLRSERLRQAGRRSDVQREETDAPARAPPHGSGIGMMAPSPHRFGPADHRAPRDGAGAEPPRRAREIHCGDGRTAAPARGRQTGCCSPDL